MWMYLGYKTLIRLKNEKLFRREMKMKQKCVLKCPLFTKNVFKVSIANDSSSLIKTSKVSKIQIYANEPKLRTWLT